jgi:hypothetical protein
LTARRGSSLDWGSFSIADSSVRVSDCKIVGRGRVLWGIDGVPDLRCSNSQLILSQTYLEGGAGSDEAGYFPGSFPGPGGDGADALIASHCQIVVSGAGDVFRGGR